MRLNNYQLLSLLVESIESAGWNVLVVDSNKPFRFRVYRDGLRGLNLCVFIWNCTHGGGAARAADEYRIQITGVVPHEDRDATTLLLGWHGEYEVFGAWDIRRHEGQDSSSPSAQIREDVLLRAHSHRFSIGSRATGEMVVAFRPEFLIDYAISSGALHRQTNHEDFDLLNDVDAITDTQIDSIESEQRRKVVATIVRRYRAADFRRRVLGAYGNRCAMCGVQLNLIDAAHIVPVASDDSSDATSNGIALCKLHHAAFDRNLVSFDAEYRIEVSNSELVKLESKRRHEGSENFVANLKAAILLPNDRRDYPGKRFIELSRQIRSWRV
ncbi:HNH endonuclease [Lysobacter sp. Root916]|uniref:HNH endonuclease n=1 Tax=Lysobacter sp. Root916 TaxID=1736606 RepID=UPI000A9BD2AA|nr:HNH endonuclease [Lysobacter sp. Root916]